VGSLRRWWRSLWGTLPGRRSAGAAGPVAAEPDAVGPFPGAGSGESDDPARRVPPRRRYSASPVTDDPQREAHLGAVLQALATGPLGRVELGRRVDAGGWGPGRFDAVVDHGIATHILVETDDGAVRARYAD
jgi:hypothetical protein